MKRYIVILLIVFAEFCEAQNVVNIVSTEANQEYKLFPEDSTGQIRFCEIINADCDCFTLINNAKLMMFDLGVSMKVDFGNVIDTPNAIRCKVTLPVNDDYIDFSKTPLWGGESVKIRRDKSTVSFVMELDFKDGKMRYKLYDFYTKRRMIRGEAKSEGQSNAIHWQRVNSLKLECNNAKKEDEIKEKQAIIEDETKQYESERKTVDIFIDKMKTLIILGVEDF